MRTFLFSVYLFLSFALLSISSLSAAQTEWLVRDTISLPEKKASNFGMGAIYLDVKQDNVSIIVREITRSSLSKASEAKDNSKLRFKNDGIRLDLSGKQDAVFINLAEGTYQITEVNVPHFDLPFRIDTDNRDVWRFNIKRDQVNYIGTLKIEGVRSKNAVNTNLLNQFATHLGDLQTRLIESSIGWPIGHGVAYDDPFFDYLKGANND
jgi:hypothetical protein